MSLSLKQIVLAVLLAALATGCVRLPDDGPVEVSAEQQDSVLDDGFPYVPPPPQPGESATEIVRHFLDAMTANPIQTSVAKQFLSTSARDAWNPERRMVTYSDVTTPTGNTDVDVTLIDANTLDSRGVWGGPLPARPVDGDVPDDRRERRVAHRQGAERDDRLGQLVRLALPAGLALLLRPDRADPGAGAGVRAVGTPVRHLADAGPAPRPGHPAQRGLAHVHPQGTDPRPVGAGVGRRAGRGDPPGRRQRPRPRDHRADDGPDRLDPAPGPERRAGAGQRGGHPDHDRRGGPRLRRRDRPGLRPQRRLRGAGPLRAAQPPDGDLGQRSRGAGRRAVRPGRLHASATSP